MNLLDTPDWHRRIGEAHGVLKVIATQTKARFYRCKTSSRFANSFYRFFDQTALIRAVLRPIRGLAVDRQTGKDFSWLNILMLLTESTAQLRRPCLGYIRSSLSSSAVRRLHGHRQSERVTVENNRASCQTSRSRSILALTPSPKTHKISESA